MREDIQFNIEFCKEVQKYSNLYDYFRSDYCLLNKNLTDQTWKKIARKCSASISECKERWKNIRGSYSKYTGKVKKSAHGTKKVKEYYLAPYLSFLDPFLKSRDTTGYVIDKSTEAEESLIKNETIASECEDNYYNNCEIVWPDECLSVNSYQSTIPPNANSLNDDSKIEMKAPESKEYHNRKRKHSVTTFEYDLNPHDYQYTKEKKQFMKIYESPKKFDPTDSDLAFLHSILPDIKSMNSSQKRHFKIGILDLAEKILTSTSTTHQLPATSSMKLEVDDP